MGSAVHIQVLTIKLFSNFFVKSPSWPGNSKMEKRCLRLFWEAPMLLRPLLTLWIALIWGTTLLLALAA